MFYSLIMIFKYNFLMVLHFFYPLSVFCLYSGNCFCYPESFDSGWLSFWISTVPVVCLKLELSQIASPYSSWWLGSCSYWLVSFLSKTNFDPGQHYSLATVDIVMSSVKFKKGKICTVPVDSYCYVFAERFQSKGKSR